MDFYAKLLGLAEKASRHRERQPRPSRAQAARLLDIVRQKRRNSGRKPPEAGMMQPAVPPKGPLPLQGGAAAPLD